MYNMGGITMEHYLYMTAFPEALVASMLPPEDFCKYLAVGTETRAHEYAILFINTFNGRHHIYCN